MPTPDAKRPPYPWLGGYPIAVVAVAASSLSILVGNTPAPVAALMLAVILTTWFGGTKPALLALVASLPALFYALPPHNSWAVDNDQIVRIPYFVGLGAFIVWLVHSERKASAALRRTH